MRSKQAENSWFRMILLKNKIMQIVWSEEGWEDYLTRTANLADSAEVGSGPDD